MSFLILFGLGFNEDVIQLLFGLFASFHRDIVIICRLLLVYNKL